MTAPSAAVMSPSAFTDAPTDAPPNRSPVTARLPTAFAGDLDQTAEMLRNLSSGNTSSIGQPDTAAMQQHGDDLAKACGFSGFRLG